MDPRHQPLDLIKRVWMWRRVLPTMPPFLMKELVEMTPNWRHTRVQRFQHTTEPAPFAFRCRCSPDGTKILVFDHHGTCIVSIKPTSLGQLIRRLPQQHNTIGLGVWTKDNTILVYKDVAYEGLSAPSTFAYVDNIAIIATNFKWFRWSDDFSKLAAISVQEEITTFDIHGEQIQLMGRQYQLRIYDPNLRFFRPVDLPCIAQRIEPEMSSFNTDASIFMGGTEHTLYFISTEMDETFGQLFAKWGMSPSSIVYTFWISLDRFLVASRPDMVSPCVVNEYQIGHATSVVHVREHTFPSNICIGQSCKISPDKKMLAFVDEWGMNAYIWDLEYQQFNYIHPADKDMFIDGIEWYPSSANLIVAQYKYGQKVNGKDMYTTTVAIVSAC